ncbi:MAG: PQQ-binding-like beta-propeller repeat protein [Oscillospiraceae bacterium]|nr:PQQ-binding-like beta-propeller repeat protein [Oscillospiraceae bacterium]
MGVHTEKKPKTKRGALTLRVLVLVVLLAVLVYLLYLISNAVPAGEEQPAETLPSVQTEAPAAETVGPTETPVPTEPPLPDFTPYYTDETDPALHVYNEAVSVDGEILGADETYHAAEEIDFGYGDDYTEMEGVITFRGNNFRDGGSYGYAEMSEFQFGDAWYRTTGTTSYNGEVWTGSGWTGQPLIVKWPAETKAVMNLYDWAKEDDELVEVIYATMDGNVYFLDLETGEATRPALDLGYTFKGAGALDPRGYPLLYLGAGYDSAEGTARVFIVSLLDCSVLYTFGNADSFSLRGSLSYFDSSPLVDAETDQLIYPGENGILYIIKLNTDYDERAGTISIDPETVKWRYYGVTTTLSQYWIGMEDSAVIWRGHLIVSDNGGRLMCLDLNTLTLDWVQNILDDSNGSPVLSIEDGHPYIYISTSFHLGWRSSSTAPVPVFKIDAENGEIIWQTEYTCYTESGVSGGVQSTIAPGKNDLEGYIYVTVAKTDQYSNGILACLDRETGEVVWEHHSYYTWSSPVLVYNSDGSGYVVYCNYANRLYLLDGLSGEVYDSFDLEGGVEASPAVYEDTVVIGTRKCRIWGVKLT